MKSDELRLMEQRRAITESLAVIEPAQAEEIVRKFIESTVGSVNEWDQQFIEFVRAEEPGRLWTATTGTGVRLFFSVARPEGIWLIERPKPGGKGFLLPSDAERLGEFTAGSGPGRP